MIGLDFSSAAVQAARDLVARSGDDLSFVQADVYDAVTELGADRFDLVYTGIGALGWLPNIKAWAAVVTELLAPGGRLFLREAHPMLWALDEHAGDGRLVVEYPYFELPEPTAFEEEQTYVRTDARFTHNTIHVWNHGLGQILTALLDRGMTITGLEEHDSAPWQAIDGLMGESLDGEYRTGRPALAAATDLHPPSGQDQQPGHQPIGSTRMWYSRSARQSPPAARCAPTLNCEATSDGRSAAISGCFPSAMGERSWPTGSGPTWRRRSW